MEGEVVHVSLKVENGRNKVNSGKFGPYHKGEGCFNSRKEA